MFKFIGCLAALASASAALGQSEFKPSILSENDGRGSTIGTITDMREAFAARALTGEEIVQEFARLCLTPEFTAEAHASAAEKSSWGYAEGHAVFAGDKKRPETKLAYFSSEFAHTSFWDGSGEALNGRPRAMRSRGVIITGPLSAKSLSGPQCNLDVKASGISDGQPLASALQNTLGSDAAKLVLKPGFADGYWETMLGDGMVRRVSFDIVDMKKPEQLVHLVAQKLPKASK